MTKILTFVEGNRMIYQSKETRYRPSRIVIRNITDHINMVSGKIMWMFFSPNYTQFKLSYVLSLSWTSK